MDKKDGKLQLLFSDCSTKLFKKDKYLQATPSPLINKFPSNTLVINNKSNIMNSKIDIQYVYIIVIIIRINFMLSFYNIH